MTFDYRSPAELSPPSVGVVRANGLAIVASPQQRRLFVSQWKSSPQCAPSARGCWSVTSASTARKSIACMRVMIILWAAERVNAQRCWILAQAKFLQGSWTEAHLDNALGLGNNRLRATFFKIDRTIWPRSGRTWRKDRCSPALSYGADLDPISLVVNYCHCPGLRTSALNRSAPKSPSIRCVDSGVSPQSSNMRAPNRISRRRITSRVRDRYRKSRPTESFFLLLGKSIIKE